MQDPTMDISEQVCGLYKSHNDYWVSTITMLLGTRLVVVQLDLGVHWLCMVSYGIRGNSRKLIQATLLGSPRWENKRCLTGSQPFM